jgi:hypothetical protein
VVSYSQVEQVMANAVTGNLEWLCKGVANTRGCLARFDLVTLDAKWQT